MPPATLGPNPPQGFGRTLSRFPLWFYRCRLGFLLGERFLMLQESADRPAAIRELKVIVNWFDELKRLVPHSETE